MNYNDVAAAWNTQHALADGRLWHEIHDRERIEFALSLAGKVEKQAPVAWKNAHAPNGLLRFMTQKQYDANPKLQKYYEPFRCAECEKLKAERDELAAQVEKMREFLQFLWRDAPLNEYTFARLEEMIALPDLSTGILNRVRAEVAERCAEVCDVHAAGWKASPGCNPMAGFVASSNCATDIRALSHDMEAGK